MYFHFTHTGKTLYTRSQSSGEEFANSVSHGIGLIAALVGVPFLITQSAKSGNAAAVIGAGVFSATMIFLYMASTLYHALTAGKLKYRFRLIEHAAIYLLIAGTYTPFTLGLLRGAWGWTLFGLIWALAIAGIVLKMFIKTSRPVLSAVLYLAMGWLIVIAAQPLMTYMPTAGLRWLIAGGLAYTVGIIFFAIDTRLRYSHLVWHLFVITGTTCHYFAVLWYAA